MLLNNENDTNMPEFIKFNEPSITKLGHLKRESVNEPRHSPQRIFEGLLDRRGPIRLDMLS